MSGAPVFRGTRVLVSTLFDYVEAGRGLDQFLKGFPTVTKGQVFQLFQEARAAGVHDEFDPKIRPPLVAVVSAAFARC
jgi:uncharacterized protein (DUF433 family)